MYATCFGEIRFIDIKFSAAIIIAGTKCRINWIPRFGFEVTNNFTRIGSNKTDIRRITDKNGEN